MRRFRCGACRAEVSFDADGCSACGHELGYFPPEQDITLVHPTSGGYRRDGDPTVWWRCLNNAWGCNWMVGTEDGTAWCVSCRLTRGRPDLEHPRAVAAWSAAEHAKRRVVHQLLSLGLPVTARRANERQLLFDLLDINEGAGATGHLDGAVSLDLREVDDAYRDGVRRQLSEPFRTVVGHLRHEVAHHYWPILVSGEVALEAFRRLFGDERADYGAALERQYREPPALSAGFVTPYAHAHPFEDWAETFAHYLHLRDGLETGAEYGLVKLLDGQVSVAVLLERWQALVDALNALNEGLGQPPAYPLRLTRSDGRDGGSSPREGTLVEKFGFVHDRVTHFAGDGATGNQ